MKYIKDLIVHSLTFHHLQLRLSRNLSRDFDVGELGFVIKALSFTTLSVNEIGDSSELISFVKPFHVFHLVFVWWLIGGCTSCHGTNYFNSCWNWDWFIIITCEISCRESSWSSLFDPQLEHSWLYSLYYLV